MGKGKKKFVDKNKATTFHLVHRSQRDPLFYQEGTTEHVLVTTDVLKKSARSIRRAELDDEYSSNVRSNEGEAAMYGVYFDDTEYDYMQHLRNIGNEDATWVEAPSARKQKPKEKNSSIQLKEDIVLPEEVNPSATELPMTYQNQQNVPDAIAGFQPDMDPRLREVLEALEEAEREEGDAELASSIGTNLEAEFAELIKEGPVDENEFYAHGEELKPELEEFNEEAVRQTGKQEWEIEFERFKHEQRKNKAANSDDDFDSEEEFDEVPELVSATTAAPATKPPKARKAKTALSAVSMTSSALFRNEGLTLLDDRFDRIEEEYVPLRDESQLVDPEQKDVNELIHDAQFNNVMDDFLTSFGSKMGRRKAPSRMTKNKKKAALAELDNVRRQLRDVKI